MGTKQMDNALYPSEERDGKMSHHEAVAIFLSIGGLLDMLCGLASYNYIVSDLISLAACHFYFLEGVTAVLGRLLCNRCLHFHSMDRVHGFSLVFFFGKIWRSFIFDRSFY